MFYIKDFSFNYPNSNNTLNYNGIIDIIKGEKILLTGASGCGKSTLLYALKGLIPKVILGHVTGQILYNNEDITKSNISSKIGIVLQNPYHQFIQKTVLEEIAFGLENLQYYKIDIIRKIDYYSKKLKIEHLINKEINQLSGGEAQKIALLSIIITEPEILLLDEPTAFLDKQSIIEFLALIDQLHFKPTIIMVEHNYNYLKNLITKSILINANGELQEISKLPIKQKYHTIDNINVNNVILEIKNLNFKYNNIQIINNFNLQLHKQEIIGIIGRSGAGKSTLLKIISGLIKDYQGEISINNKNIQDYKKNQLYQVLSLLFQNPENNFIYNKVINEVDNLDILIQFNLNNSKDQNPFSLSEGQKRRLSILASTTVNKQKIYLLDEPTFGQDHLNINILIDFIGKLNQNGASFIVVSHDVDFLNSITNNIIELK